MTFGMRIGGTRPRVVLLGRDEYDQVRRLKPFTRPALVTNTAACPAVGGKLLTMPRPEGAHFELGPLDLIALSARCGA